MDINEDLSQLLPDQSSNQPANDDCSCLLDFLIRRCTEYPDRTVFTYLDIHLKERCLTYAELLFQVQEYALILKNKGIQKGDRCLLIFDQSIEFIIAFFACQWIGAIPVPLNIPGRLKPLDKWENIARECQPEAIITGKESATRLMQSLSRSELLGKLPLIDVEIIVSQVSTSSLSGNPDSHPVAFLQYTSGSTGSPKGGVVTQDSLIKNSREPKKNMNVTQDSVFVSWLPFYHDMGLILCIIQTIYSGCRLYLMKPEDFMSKPLNWVLALSKWKGTHTGAPNFAYQLVADKLLALHNDIKTKSVSHAEISLKELKVCVSGAEPVRIQTISDFQRAIALYGANDDVISPGYGLAEATLTVSLNKEGEKVKWLKVSKEDFRKNVIIVQEHGVMESDQVFPEEEDFVYLVSNGQVIDNHEVHIIDVAELVGELPDSIDKLRRQAPYEVGEFWFSGPSVTNGYYENTKATSESYFYSRSNNTTYLRTGDLAFRDEDGQIYIAGRIKDLIIIRGLNYYPQDLERTSCYAHPDLRIDGAAAFSLNKGGNEYCVIVQELTRNAVRTPKFDEYAKAIRTAILKEHGVSVESILFVPPMYVPRTTSGKIQRRFAKRTTELNQWESLLYTSHLSATTSSAEEPDVSQAISGEAKLTHTLSELTHFLQTRVDSYTIDERRSIPPYIHTEFARMGLMGLLVSTSSGGWGGNLRQARVIIETIASADATLGLFVSLHNLLGLHPIIQFAQKEIREKIVNELATGKGTASFALSEPGAGSNPNAGKTLAQRRDGHWVLNGEKCWVGSSSWASYLTVIAHTQDEKGKYLGLSAFLVPQGTPGLQHIEECMTMGMRGSVQGHFTMTNVSIPESHVLGEPGKGAEVLQEVVSMGRIGINSMCIGILKTVLSRSKRWAENRKVNSGYLIGQPVVIRRLNEILWSLEIIEAYQAKLVKWKDAGLWLPEMLVSAGKIFSTEETWKAVDFLMQITAARGYSEHNGIAQLFRDARVLRIFEGPSESLIADLGGRTDETIAETLLFLVDQHVLLSIDDSNEKIKHIKLQLEQKHSGYDRPHDYSKNKKIIGYAWGEVLTCQLIVWMCGNDISSDAKKWIEKRTKSIITDALEYDTSLLAVEQFEKQFNKVLKDHQSIYTQPEYSDHSSHSPFRDLRRIEMQNVWRQIEDNDKKEVPEVISNPGESSSIKSPNYGKYKAVSEIEAWMYGWLEKEAGIDRRQFTSHTSFSEYGLDSSLSIRFVSDINAYYATHIEPSIIWNYSTVNELATYLYEFEINSSTITSAKEKQGIDDDFLKTLLEDEIK